MPLLLICVLRDCMSKDTWIGPWGQLRQLFAFFLSLSTTGYKNEMAWQQDGEREIVLCRNLLKIAFSWVNFNLARRNTKSEQLLWLVAAVRIRAHITRRHVLAFFRIEYHPAAASFASSQEMTDTIEEKKMRLTPRPISPNERNDKSSMNPKEGLITTTP